MVLVFVWEDKNWCSNINSELHRNFPLVLLFIIFLMILFHFFVFAHKICVKFCNSLPLTLSCCSPSSTNVTNNGGLNISSVSTFGLPGVIFPARVLLLLPFYLIVGNRPQSVISKFFWRKCGPVIGKKVANTVAALKTEFWALCKFLRLKPCTVIRL